MNPSLLLLALLAACSAPDSAAGVASRDGGPLRVTPGAALLVGPDETVQLAAVFGVGGPKADVEWSSDDPALATVDADGTVQAVAAAGAVRILARSGDEVAETLVLIARPRPDAVLIDDARVVSPTENVDADGEPPWDMRTVLSGVEVEVGDPILARGEAVIAGVVTGATAVEGGVAVVWRSTGPADVFDGLELDLKIPIAPSSLLPEESPNGMDVQLEGTEIVFTESGNHAAKTDTIGPCTVEVAAVGVGMSLSDFIQPKLTAKIDPSLSMDIEFAGNDLTRALVAGGVASELTAAFELKQEVEGTADCSLALAAVKYPFPGPLGMFVNVGADLAVFGKAKVALASASATVGVKAVGQTTVRLGVERDVFGDLGVVTESDSVFTPTPLVSGPASPVTLTASVMGGGRATMTVGLPLGADLALANLDAGPLMQWQLTPVQTQATDPELSASYAGKVVFELSPGKDVDAALAQLPTKKPELSLVTTLHQFAGTPLGGITLTPVDGSDTWEGVVSVAWPNDVDPVFDYLHEVVVYSQTVSEGGSYSEVHEVARIEAYGPGDYSFEWSPSGAETLDNTVITAFTSTLLGGGGALEYEVALNSQTRPDACPNNVLADPGFESPADQIWTYVYNGSAVTSYVDQAIVAPRSGARMGVAGWGDDPEVTGSAMYQIIGDLEAGDYTISFWTRTSAHLAQEASCATRDNPNFSVSLGRFDDTSSSVAWAADKEFFPSTLLCSGKRTTTGNYTTTADWQEHTVSLSLDADTKAAFLAFQVYHGNPYRYLVFVDDVRVLPAGMQCE